jgi:hypothetical protein
MNTRLSPMSYVYDGRICRGFVIARSSGFEAFDSDERSLGACSKRRQRLRMPFSTARRKRRGQDEH